MATIARRPEEPSPLDPSEVPTARLVLPERLPPASTWPRFIGRRGGRLRYMLTEVPEPGRDRVRTLVGAFGRDDVVLYLYNSDEPTNVPPMQLSYDELEAAHSVGLSILCSPTHGFLPRLEEGK